jgi:hypothetical protein
VTANYVAGSTYTARLGGTVNHDGGSCQLSLSYDGGGTFRVIKSFIGGCPLQDTMDFTIPEFAPTGQAIFAWTWFNFRGLREMYMNCAPVMVQGNTQASGEFDNLPEIFTANINNGCATVEGRETVFEHPGWNPGSVVYANNVENAAPYPVCPV